MSVLRVFELAKQLNVSSKDVLRAVQGMGEYVRSASSILNPSLVRRVEEWFEAGEGQRLRLSSSIARPGGTSATTWAGEADSSGEVSEDDILRNLAGGEYNRSTHRRPSDRYSRERRRRSDTPQRRNREGDQPSPRRASKPIPVVAELLIDPYEQAIHGIVRYRTLEELTEDACAWQATELDPRVVADWLGRAGKELDPGAVKALIVAGFTPANAFREFSPSGGSKTTTPYLLVAKRGLPPDKVREMFQTARERRRMVG